jgi:O-antigen ligase
MDSRIYVWQGALHIIERRPFLGYGYGWKKMAFVAENSNLPDYWKQYYPDIYSYYVENAHSGYGRVNPHNLMLQIVFEIGLIGLGIFLYFWTTIIFKIFEVASSNQRSETRNMTLYSIGILIPYLLINITNGFWQETYGNMIFLFMASVFVIYRQYANESKVYEKIL